MAVTDEPLLLLCDPSSVLSAGSNQEETKRLDALRARPEPQRHLRQRLQGLLPVLSLPPPSEVVGGEHENQVSSSHGTSHGFYFIYD